MLLMKLLHGILIKKILMWVADYIEKINYSWRLIVFHQKH